MTPQTLRFFRNGRVVTLDGVDPSRTLLQVLREDLHACGTKEGCGEGDCGACCVVVAQPSADGTQLDYRTINSCIRLAHSIDGMALWTVEDIAPSLATAPESAGADFAGAALPPEGAQPGLGRPGTAAIAPKQYNTLHPAQEAMVQCHGSQCGFCTPGFVMSLFGLYQNHTARGQVVSREQATQALSGNLCRCTGYRPIVDAALTMQTAPLCTVDEAEVLSNLQLLAHIPRGLEADLASNSAYISPRTLSALLAARAEHPEAQLVAGCTDVGLWVTKMHQQFSQVIDTTRVAELRRIEPYPHHLAIGAAVTLTDAFAALVADRPQLAEFAHRFAGLPVRNSGTLGGNVANGSPIGDSMPLLIALGASVVLMRQQGKAIAHREMPLEDLYSGYRQNVMAADEVLAWIKVPKATPPELLRVYKISKRFEDDISAVCLAIRLHIEDGTVHAASIGVGGVAATPVRARRTEKALQGQSWSAATVEHATPVLMDEFAPISDMRASAAYRTQVLGNLLQRFWLEAQGEVPSDVRRLHPLGVHA